MASRADEHNLNPPVSAEEADYEQLIEDYTHFAPPHEGELLQGRVVKRHDTDVIVDFGYKSEGLVPIEQFLQPDGTIQVQVGDTDRCHDGPAGNPAGRLHPALPRKGQPLALLGQPGESLPRRTWSFPAA